MAYTNESIDARAEVASDLTDTLVYFVKRDGMPVNVDSASAFVTLLSPVGVELAPRAAATQAAGGRLSVSKAWALATYPVLEDYIAVWEWQESGTVFADRQYFDVVKTKFLCPIDTSDVQELYPDIASHLAALGETDCSKFIRRAWSRILDRLRVGKSRASLILEKQRLVNPALELTCFYVCRALSRQFEDVWDMRMKDHKKEYEALFGSLGELKYDIDEDGTANETETKRVNKRAFTV